MSRFKVIHQCEQGDCGAACLAMIVCAHGLRVSLEAVRAHCGGLKNGVTMLGLNRAAARLGFATRAVRLSRDEFTALDASLLPLIVHWRQNHFVVVYRVTPRHIYVADPAIGRVRYCHDEFFDAFAVSDGGDGFALLLHADKLDPSLFASQPREVLPLRQYITPQRRRLAWGALSLLSLSLIGLAFPFLTRAVVDRGIAGNDPRLLTVILCATITLAVAHAVIGFLQARMALMAGTLMDIELSRDLLLKVAALPMRLFAVRKVGDLIQRVGDVARVGDYFSSRVAQSALSAVTFIIYGGVLIYMHWGLFVVFVTGAALYVGYICLFLRRRKVVDYQLFGAAAKSQEELIQYLRGMTELKLAGAATQRLAVWRRYRDEHLDAARRSLSLSQQQEMGSVLIFRVVDALVIYIMAMAVMNGESTLGSMMAVQYIVGSMNGPLQTMTQFIRETQSMSLALDRINYIAASEPEREGGARPDVLTAPAIHIQDVTFRYDIDATRPALRDACVDIPAGKTTALVGKSGSGKTTLLKLLLGFYSPERGTVSVDGLPLERIDLAAWRTMTGAVMQDGYIFSDTILRNVALGDDEPEVERVTEALTVACADFAFDLPVGLRTVVGAEGLTLSSGQCQRLLLARAIYKRPTVLLLDEATNALDAINERRIYDNLREVTRGKTVVIAAHRLSTIRNADRIVVFDDGAVVEVGTHDELIARGGAYAELVNNQRFN